MRALSRWCLAIFAALNIEPLDATFDDSDSGFEAPDGVAARLAEQFAPLVLYAADEPNLPMDVPSYLQKAELWFFSGRCSPSNERVGYLTSTTLSSAAHSNCREVGQMVAAAGTRSALKTSTFYLRSLTKAELRGSAQTERWITYCHAYCNNESGLTLQYWRFYAYDTSFFFNVRLDSLSHGGDWEAVHVVLGPPPHYQPLQLRLLGHSLITTVSWREVTTDAGHPVIRAKRGSHTSELASRKDLVNRTTFIEHASWTGGWVRWPSGRQTQGGPVLLIGNKIRPRPGMEWVQYSGLWGTRKSSGLLAYYGSGYWGPAFNETGMRPDGFVSAWCEGIAEARTPAAQQPLRQECYPVKSID
jgi:hypothetical protein